MCLHSLPNTSENPKVAQVFAADERELKSLDEFIAYKEKLILRGSDPIRNTEVVDKIQLFKKYLKEFPQENQEAFSDLSFWPSEIVNNNEEEPILQNVEDEGTNAGQTLDVDMNATGSGTGVQVSI